jgi:iron complex outermembrane receptor protein
LRASAGTGFKAPNMNDLYAAQSEGYPTFIDWVSCKREQQNDPSDTPSCSPRQWKVRSGGNKNLEEERSKSYNLGVIVQPNKKYNFGLDLWQTRITNVVGMQSADDYQMATLAESQGINPADHGVIINRDSSGNIEDEPGSGMYAPLLNLASQEVRGLDFSAAGHFDNGFNVSMNHSHIAYFRQESFPGMGYKNRLGTNGMPPWRNSINVNFVKRKHSFSLLAKTIAKHQKTVRQDGDLPRYTEFDFSYNLQLFEKTTFTFIVQNILGTIPPLDNSNPNSQLDTSLYSPRGQLAFVGIKQGF